MEKEWIIPVSEKLFNDGTFLQLFHQNGIGDESNVVLFLRIKCKKKAPFFNGGKGEKFVRITVL